MVSAGLGDARSAANLRRTRVAQGALVAAGVNGGAGVCDRAILSTSLASASSIHRNGIVLRIGLLPSAVFGTGSNIVARRSAVCEVVHILVNIQIIFRRIRRFQAGIRKG